MYLCELFGKKPSDSFFEEMDPFEKLWFYEGWVNKLDQDVELKKSIAILTGGFSNPELAQKMIKRDRPDHVSTDEEFEATWQMVQENRENQENGETKRQRRRRRKRRKNNN